MKTSKLIGACIQEIKLMLADGNNELTSGQRETLMSSIRELKRLQKATRVPHQELFAIVARISAAAYELLESQVRA